MNRQQSSKSKQVWITDPSNKKFSQIKTNFYTALLQQSKDAKIGYYDFLLVAKKLSFRFQQSTHLMALKNYFSKNKNLVLCKKLSDCLSISEQSLETLEQKVVVKFNVPEIQFAPIKQQTLEDQQYQGNSQNLDQQIENAPFQKLGDSNNQGHQSQLIQKMTIILSIKVEEMQNKLNLLTTSPKQNILNYFQNFQNQKIYYEQFKTGIIEIVSINKDKIKLSQDDVKTIFHLLDENKNQYITNQNIQKLKNSQSLLEQMKAFYKARINKDMVKNTLFKLGKVKNNSIQIYQLKNASVMQFKQMQQSILAPSSRNAFSVRSSQHQVAKSRIPHFGPLKGATKWKLPHQSQPSYHPQYASTHPIPPHNMFSINKQRQKIEKILRQSKDMKLGKEKNGETVASKLRSLFIHKVILPRERMLEEEKERFIKAKMPEHQLSIKPYK